MKVKGLAALLLMGSLLMGCESVPRLRLETNPFKYIPEIENPVSIQIPIYD